MSTMLASEIRPGDVLEYPCNKNHVKWGTDEVCRHPVDIVTVHHVHIYETGDAAIRYRHTSNPRGIDWSGFVEADGRGIRLLSRGVAAVDTHARGLLPE